MGTSVFLFNEYLDSGAFLLCAVIEGNICDSLVVIDVVFWPFLGPATFRRCLLIFLHGFFLLLLVTLMHVFTSLGLYC